ncbi:MAG: DUF554 domain-containing protein [Candidatus Fimenecus sp.]
MFGMGTLINTAAVILGGIIGILLRKGLKENIRKTLMAACGIATIFIGVAGTLEGMLTVKDGKIETQGAMLLIFSLVIGGFLGELIDIEKGMDFLGERLKKTFSRENDSRFAEGFVNSSLIICIGAMAIVGSIEDGLTGDFSMLAAKSVLDFVVVIILASSYGAGAVFSALAVFVYEGALTVAAHFAGSFISDEIVRSLSYIGSALIFCVGINITFGKKIRVGNLLPALLIPVIYIYAKTLL